MEKKKVLILGASGMLGSMLYDYLNRNDMLEVAGTYREIYEFCNPKHNNYCFKFNATANINQQLSNIYKKFQFEYVINAVGIIKPYCKDDDTEGVFNAILVNALFPHNLAQSSIDIDDKIKIIQIATDCVFSGKKGNYMEDDKHDALDVYGKTKSLGEVKSKNLLNIRCSIIGPEMKGKLSLLEWFLSNEKGTILSGFDHHKWNGVTTLQFAQLCEKIISEELFYGFRKINNVLHYVINETVTKYELLCLFKKIYNKSYTIRKITDPQNYIDRTLDSRYLHFDKKPMKKAVEELKKYQDKHYFGK